eukprot:1641273-Rhodomonas_salina.1
MNRDACMPPPFLRRVPGYPRVPPGYFQNLFALGLFSDNFGTGAYPLWPRIGVWTWDIAKWNSPVGNRRNLEVRSG